MGATAEGSISSSSTTPELSSKQFTTPPSPRAARHSLTPRPGRAPSPRVRKFSIDTRRHGHSAPTATRATPTHVSPRHVLAIPARPTWWASTATHAIPESAGTKAADRNRVPVLQTTQGTWTGGNNMREGCANRMQIRCSGFEASDDGRCTNCQRFQQECIFTPVSSQAQAFVPAHTAYPHLRNSGAMPPRQGGRAIYPQQGQPAIYGAHGQPLGPPMGHDPNYPPPPHGYPMPPHGAYQGAPVYDDRGPPQPPHAQDKVSLKRLRSDESFQPAPPPPAPPEEFSSHPYQGHPPAPTGRRGSGGGFEYPDPTGLVPASPASSANSFQSAPYPPQGQPYYPPPPPQPQQQPPRRSSPQSAYSYEQRASGSPHGSASSASASGYTYPGGLHPPQVLPPRDQGRTPPPAQRDGNGNGNGNGSGQRGGMAVRDLLGPGGQNDSGGRSSADSDMLRQLNKKGPN